MRIYNANELFWNYLFSWKLLFHRSRFIQQQLKRKWQPWRSWFSFGAVDRSTGTYFAQQRTQSLMFVFFKNAITLRYFCIKSFFYFDYHFLKVIFYIYILLSIGLNVNFKWNIFANEKACPRTLQLSLTYKTPGNKKRHRNH